MEYQQKNFQDMIEKYNRELLETYQRHRPTAASTAEQAVESTVQTPQNTAETAAEEVAVPMVERVTETHAEEAGTPPQEDTYARYPTYDAPPAQPIAAPVAEPVAAPVAVPDEAMATEPGRVPTVTPGEESLFYNTAPPSEVGYLQVWVTTATSALPIEGAHVTISSNIGDTAEQNVRFVGVTDRSGRTEIFPLPAASGQLSLTPTETRIPYTLYNIEVYADGFYRVQNMGLPLYGGVSAVQPVKLIPLPEYSEQSDTMIFQDSAPQGLNGEEAEA